MSQQSDAARRHEFRFAWSWTRRIHSTPWTFDVRVIALGWWVRFCWGVTFKPERLRWRRFHGYRLLGVRLWGAPLDGRIVLVQWKRAERNVMGRLVA